jgi:tetratricopeptide (TPR) repeat protein
MSAGRLTMVALVVIAYTTDDIRAQLPKGEVSWDLSVPEGEYLGQPGRAYRTYGAAEQLQLILTVINSSEDPLFVEPSTIKETFTLQVLDGGEEVPVAIEWPLEMSLHGETLPVRYDLGPFRFGPHTGGSWRLAVRRADGERFSTGAYGLVFWIHGLQRAVRTLDDKQWDRSAYAGPGKLQLVVNPAATPVDVAMMYVLKARDAMMRRAYTEALDAYSRAIASDPGNIEAKAMSGHAYMILRRYREAIEYFEEVLKRAPGVWSPTRLALAGAYMALHEESNAIHALRAGGLPEAQVVEEISKLRQAYRR